MRVYLDDEELHPAQGTLADGLHVALDAARAQGRIIIEAKADDDPIADEDLDHPPDDPTYCDELRFVSAEPRSLVRVTMLDAADALEQTRGVCERASEMLQTGQTAEALRELGDTLGAWESARRVVQEGCALLSIDIESDEGLGAGAPEMIETLSTNLEEIKRTVATQDWAALADLLAFDLDEQAAQWRDIMVRIADSVAQ